MNNQVKCQGDQSTHSSILPITETLPSPQYFTNPQSDVQKFTGSSSSASATSGGKELGTTPGKVPPTAPAEYEDIPLTSMRRTIGKRLLESTQQLPHFYATAEINMGESESKISRSRSRSRCIMGNISCQSIPRHWGDPGAPRLRNLGIQKEYQN